MSTDIKHTASPLTIGLFILLFAIGSTYLVSLGYFVAKDKNFTDVQKTQKAINFARTQRLALPSQLSFTKSSTWSGALATGWNQPETWGVWSNRADATIVLPSFKNKSNKQACFTFSVGAMSHIGPWPMLIAVNGHPLTREMTLHGAGPYSIQGMVPIGSGDLVRVELSGPAPRIPNLMSRHTTDARELAFRLLGITVTPKCLQTQ